MKLLLKAVLLCVLGFTPVTQAQSQDELTNQARELDDILFEQSFNSCKTAELYNIIAEDLEFYHDVGGLMRGKQAYIDSIEQGICTLDYKASRELKEGTFEVFPLRANGEIYAMVVEGEHSFYAQYPDKQEKQHTSDANFSIIWVRDGEHWKMKRVLSFNHH